MKIRVKITLVLLVMINLAIIISGVFIYQNTDKIIRSAIEKNVKNLLESEKRNVELRLNQEMSMPFYLTRDTHVINLLMDSTLNEEKNKVSALLKEYYNKRQDLEAVFLVDRNGTIIADVNPNMLGVDLSDRAYHQKTMKSKKVVIGEIIQSKNTGEQIFMLTIIIIASLISFFIAKKISNPIINKLMRNNEELSALYEQITASEEELHAQLDEIQNSKVLLEVSELKYRTLLDNSDDIIYSCECDKMILTVNETFCEHYHNIPMPVGKNMLTLIEDNSLKALWTASFDKVVQTHMKVMIDSIMSK